MLAVEKSPKRAAKHRMQCQMCFAVIWSAATNRKYCGHCRVVNTRQRTSSRDARRSAEIGRVSLSDLRPCKRCAHPFRPKSASGQYCHSCKPLAVADQIARASAAKAKRDGTIRTGCVISCGRCGCKFEITAPNQHYCRPCAHQNNSDRKAKETARAKTDPRAKLNMRMRTKIWRSLRGDKNGRSWQSLVNYTLTELKTHIEKQFLPGMAWEDSGAWHIDHVIPLKEFSFESADDEAFKAAWALTNLRPLWALDNLKKNARRTHLL